MPLLNKQVESGDAEFYNNRGIAYAEKGQYDLAIPDYTEALEINPRLADAYCTLGGLMLAIQINGTITKFTDAFNVNDLDRVMTFFSDDAVYEPGDGKIHRGKAEIRAAFEPQFNGAFGAMRFDERDMVIDVENRKAAFRWVCRHDISHAKPRGLVMFLRGIVTRWVVGDRFGWQGVDIFHFDADGKIKGKFTYGWYGSRPHIQRALR